MKEYDAEKSSIYTEDSNKFKRHFNHFVDKSSKFGLEVRGIQPVTLEERTHGIGALLNIASIWLSANSTVLTLSTGGLGPSSFYLSARDSCLTILFFNLLGNLLPSYLGTFGPKLGMRQMCITRYSFGYYPVILVCLLNLIGMIGFCSLNAVSGGQVLSAVSNGSLNWNVGIVIIAVIALIVSFAGFKFLHTFERYAWMVITVMFIFVAGCAGRHLDAIYSVPFDPATPGAILSFGAVVLGYGMTWAPLASDFSAYLPPETKSWKVFLCNYIGLNLPLISLQCFGAIVQVGAMAIPEWTDGYDQNGLGGLLDAIMTPLKGFRKFVLTNINAQVVLALGISSNNAPTIYSCSLTLQTFLPILLYVPRFLLSTLATGVYLPIAIVIATRFQEALNNFLSCLGYWTALFGSILIVDHLLFRKGNFASYDISQWDNPRGLPMGIAALIAGLIGCGIVVVSMAQIWWTGPLASAIDSGGDLATELGFVVSGLAYIPLKYIELLIEKRINY
ncbi:cytosine-purine permease [Wallemia mellicola]|uniref:Cytosine-purine permease n=1 Tax=Wallemia mellicola TaxID=1708541 RepID=A0AB74KC83_9BASI|nr:cytosine-purine permease [Wallemia mellicola]TIC39517.1 cytosine-purine permease [Wallemia mellicola]TIC47734.1 cytosine-purine permease [Wallemia mellicola]TIC54164.1 cytosine-purine permease [Wallemia mellicola]TIC61096.1 cytosine-purine permease [Wallemia mellicola]